VISGKPIVRFPDHVQAQKWPARMRFASRVFRRLAQRSAAKLGTWQIPAALSRSFDPVLVSTILARYQNNDVTFELVFVNH
jgi:hypothetical protein